MARDKTDKTDKTPVATSATTATRVTGAAMTDVFGSAVEAAVNAIQAAMDGPKLSFGTGRRCANLLRRFESAENLSRDELLIIVQAAVKPKRRGRPPGSGAVALERSYVFVGYQATLHFSLNNYRNESFGGAGRTRCDAIVEAMHICGISRFANYNSIAGQVREFVKMEKSMNPFLQALLSNLIRPRNYAEERCIVELARFGRAQGPEGK